MSHPASHCRRALQRQISPPRDSVWISDGLLASAFERYCRVSQTWNRKASNVPGPLESRRRLGRRRMADASTWHGPPTPPPWAFLAPLNLTQWTWQPPSLTRDTGRTWPRHDDDAIAIAAGELASLRTDRPRGGDDGPPIGALTSAVSLGPSSTAAITKQASRYADLMGDFRRTAMHPDDDAFAAATNKMCAKFQQKIMLGEISPDEVISLSTEIWRTLDLRLQGSPLCCRLSLSFCRAVMDGLTTSRVFTPSLLGLPFWDTLLAEMSNPPPDDALCHLLVSVMKSMPAVHRPHVSDRISALLARFASEWDNSASGPQGRDIRRLLDISILGEHHVKQEEVVLPLPACLRQAKTLSELLPGATPEEIKELLSDAQRRILNEAVTVTADRRALRYSWLYLLAQTPQVNEDYLFEAAAALSAPSLNTQPLSMIEVSSLLLTQWISRGYVMSPELVHQTFRRHRPECDEAALASLFLALFHRGKSESRKGHYRSAWKFLSKISQTDYVIQSLTLEAQPGNLPVRMLEDLACSSHDHRAAIALRDLWSTRIRTSDLPEWYPGTFGRYATAIIQDPSIPAKEIWRVLDIGKLERKGTTFVTRMQRHRNVFGRSRAAIVEKMAKEFMTAPHLSNRAALRHVTRCFAFLRVVRGAAPDDILLDIYRLVTHDLWDDKPGRTKRLLWFLRLLERRHGIEVSWPSRLVLKEWRARMARDRMSGEGGRSC
ncbi:hypothetical protein C8A05DRAFT_19502 [Staphylotrichum tortipilum]|uniref:Uncharacterized protein n=1 Tax=Staphylotrichum tortipilum TaxID=2831512 RepID=A0AAN6MD71_9PEZI|nr:hypothetical protein C8A05DRAFT_19502 [Staphylotrichum longicolle]